MRECGRDISMSRAAVVILLLLLPFACSKKIEDPYGAFLSKLTSYFNNLNAIEVEARRRNGVRDSIISLYLFDRDALFLNGLQCDNTVQGVGERGLEGSRCGFENRIYYVPGAKYGCIKCGKRFQIEPVNSPKELASRLNMKLENVIEAMDAPALIGDIYMAKARYMVVTYMTDTMDVIYTSSGAQGITKEIKALERVKDYSVFEQDFAFDGESVYPVKKAVEIYTLAQVSRNALKSNKSADGQ